MKTFLNRHIAALLVLAFIVASPVRPSRVWADDAPKPAQAAGKCMMWKVSSGTATVYLVGSMHLATPEMYPLPKEMEDAFAKSDTLVVEININKLDQQKVMTIVQAKGLYQGTTLSKSIKKETFDRAVEVCQGLGLPAAGIEIMKPWLLAMTIEEMEVQKAGLDPKLGIDMHFLSLAAKKNMPIEELETMELQLGALAGFDDKQQEKYLAQTLDDVKDIKEDVEKMTKSWIAGDGQGLVDLMTKRHPDAKEILQKIIFDRNGPMADKVEGYLKGKKTVMVIAGCAHMVGDQGIVARLEKDNFKVEQSSATRPAKVAE